MIATNRAWAIVPKLKIADLSYLDQHFLAGQVYKPIGSTYPQLLVAVRETDTGIESIPSIKLGPDDQDPWTPMGHESIPAELMDEVYDLLEAAVQRLRDRHGESDEDE